MLSDCLHGLKEQASHNSGKLNKTTHLKKSYHVEFLLVQQTHFKFSFIISANKW